LPQIQSKYIDTGKVKLEFRHYPLTQIHAKAEISSVAAECANRQGKFWQYHDLLYQNGQADGAGLDKDSLVKYANQLGLNSGTLGFGKNKFNQCLDSNATLDVVNKDLAEGGKDGVSGTPSFFINGQQIVGAQPFAQFQTAIEAALAGK
jgi:protein-disulfide isomerase